VKVVIRERERANKGIAKIQHQRSESTKFKSPASKIQAKIPSNIQSHPKEKVKIPNPVVQ
jgi:hypothetical protein